MMEIMRWMFVACGLVVLVGCKSKDSLTGDRDGGGSTDPVCGNGVIEDGESCDGDCGSCDDNNACTQDIVNGSAETCDVTCSRDVLSACADGDGCCPAGCDNGTDDDCSATCGDSNLDPNETCDPPSSCPTTCDDGDACTSDLLTGSSANCNAQCATFDTTACANGDGCCPTGCDASTDSDCSASCGNTCADADGCCPTACTYANDDDCPPPMSAPLDQRIQTVDVTAPAGVKAGDSNWRIWGAGSLGVSPVFTVPYADCGTLVGYTTTTGGVHTARVARLDANDQLVTTYDLGTFVLRGLSAEPDGNWGALLWQRDSATPNNSKMFVRRYDTAGAQQFSTELDNTNAAADDFNIGESRLEYDVPNTRYGAYFHVHGKPGYFADGHEGDALFWVDKTTGAASLGWQWGCSHSMSNLLRYSPAASFTVPICASDCYPGTTGTNFASDSIGGIYLERSASKKVRNFDAGCNGSVATELGGAAPGAAGWKLVFNGHQNPAVNGQGSYDKSTMNQDIGFQAISDTRTMSGSIVWLTTSSGVNEANSAIARWQPMGDTTEQYVVGWTSSPTGETYYLARVGATGAFLEGPIAITSAKWGRRDDPFRTHLNGDIVWAWFDSAGSTTLRFARLQSGGTATCAQL